MNKKEKQITIKVGLNINIKTYRFDTGAKKTWIIPLLVLGLKILALCLKYHGS